MKSSNIYSLTGRVIVGAIFMIGLGDMDSAQGRSQRSSSGERAVANRSADKESRSQRSVSSSESNRSSSPSEQRPAPSQSNSRASSSSTRSGLSDQATQKETSQKVPSQIMSERQNSSRQGLQQLQQKRQENYAPRQQNRVQQSPDQTEKRQQTTRGQRGENQNSEGARRGDFNDQEPSSGRGLRSNVDVEHAEPAVPERSIYRSAGPVPRPVPVRNPRVQYYSPARNRIVTVDYSQPQPVRIIHPQPRPIIVECSTTVVHHETNIINQPVVMPSITVINEPEAPPEVYQSCQDEDYYPQSVYYEEPEGADDDYRALSSYFHNGFGYCYDDGGGLYIYQSYPLSGQVGAVRPVDYTGGMGVLSGGNWMNSMNSGLFHWSGLVRYYWYRWSSPYSYHCSRYGWNRLVSCWQATYRPHCYYLAMYLVL